MRDFSPVKAGNRSPEKKKQEMFRSGNMEPLFAWLTYSLLSNELMRCMVLGSWIGTRFIILSMQIFVGKIFFLDKLMIFLFFF